MLNRKVKVEARAESGAIGEVRHEGEHTYINSVRLTIFSFKLINEVEGIPGYFFQILHMDEKEFEALLAHGISRQRETFYQALDQLSETERNEILAGYYKRKPEK